MRTELAEISDKHRETHSRLQEAEREIVRHLEEKEQLGTAAEKMRSARDTVQILMTALRKRLVLRPGLVDTVLTFTDDGSVPHRAGTRCQRTACTCCHVVICCRSNSFGSYVRTGQCGCRVCSRSSEGMRCKVDQLTESLNAQIKTHKDAEADAIKRAGMLNAEIADMKAKLAEVERENKLAAEQYELLRINVRFP